MESFFEGLFILVVLLVMAAFALGVYFAPTFVAVAMHHPHILGVLLLNLFTGWTGVGWLGSLIWAVIV